MNHAVHYMVQWLYPAQDLLHECRQLPLEFIAQKTDFDS